MTALAWLVWRVTGSGAKLGAIRFLEQIPILVLAPMAGVIADRVSRLRLVMLTQALAMSQAFVLAVYVLRGGEAFGFIAWMALVMGLILAFDMPARQALMVELVGKEDLGNAIALNSFAFNGARIVGPAINGLLLTLGLSEGACFLLNGASFAVVLVTLATIRVEGPTSTARTGSILGNLCEGLRFTARHDALNLTLWHIGAISLMGFPFLAIAPMVAEDLGRAAGGYSMLLTFVGVGAILSAVVLARGVESLGQGRLLPATGLLFALSLIAFSFARPYWLACALAVPTGGLMMLQVVGTNTFIQKLAPDRLRGRVISLFYMMSLGVMPVGSLAIGWLADRLGDPMAAIRVGGAVGALASVAVLTKLPAIVASAKELSEME